MLRKMLNLELPTMNVPTPAIADKEINPRLKPATWNDTQPAAEVIQELAAQHDITATKSARDHWCDDVSRLSDDDVELDEIEQLLLNIDKQGIYDEIALTKLHFRYMRERKAA